MTPDTQSLLEVAKQRPVVVCCGPGGVGKTTVSAAFAMKSAQAGRRACVVTVDPARRLATALGLESLPNSPTLVKGDWPGELHALMLDSKGTFDDLVHRYARNSEQADSIIGNRLYQSLAGRLSGTQEYMAMEKLYELTEDGAFDVVVVDTPPTRSALELLEAPSRLTRFLENRIFRALLLPTRASFRMVSFATQALLRTISRVAGAEIVNDAVAFFKGFQGMEEGFRKRAAAVRELLADPSTAYLLVTSPREDAVAEASYFAERLDTAGIRAAGVVVNRVHPRFDGGGSGPATRTDDAQGPWAVLAGNLRQLNTVAEREEQLLGRLAELADHPVVGRIPLLEGDVHDLDGLAVVTSHLFDVG